MKNEKKEKEVPTWGLGMGPQKFGRRWKIDITQLYSCTGVIQSSNQGLEYCRRRVLSVRY